MEAGMTRISAESNQGRSRLGFVGWLASSVVFIAICGTAAAQDDGSKPPDLIPLEPIGPLKPLGEVHYHIPREAGSSSTSEVSLHFMDSNVSSLALTAPRQDNDADQEKKSPKDDPLSRWRETKDAIAYWDEEIRTHPDRAGSYYQRGLLRTGSIRWSDRAACTAVIGDMSEALKRDPAHIEALAFRGYMRVETDDVAGVTDLDRVIERSPNHVLANYARARAYSMESDFDAALERLGRIVNVTGDLAVRVNYLRAECLAKKGRYEAAVASLTESMATGAFEAERYLERASWYHEFGAREMARADVAEFIRLRNGDVNARAVANLVLLQIGELGGAYLDAESLLRDHPDDPFPYLLRFAARYMDVCRRDRVLRQVERVADRAQVLLPLQPIPGMIRAWSYSMTGLGRELALKDMEHGLDQISGLSFPHACGAIVNACEGRLMPTCRDLLIFAVRFNPRQYRFTVSLGSKGRRLNFSLAEHCSWGENPMAAGQSLENPTGEHALEIILAALSSAANQVR